MLNNLDMDLLLCDIIKGGHQNDHSTFYLLQVCKDVFWVFCQSIKLKKKKKKESQSSLTRLNQKLD